MGVLGFVVGLAGAITLHAILIGLAEGIGASRSFWGLARKFSETVEQETVLTVLPSAREIIAAQRAGLVRKMAPPRSYCAN